MKTRQIWPVAASLAVLGGGVLADQPNVAPAPGIRLSDIRLTAGDAHQDIIVDIVRHGQRMPPYNSVITPSPDHPGPPLSELGVQQAQDVANQLHSQLGDQVAGIFSGQAIRDMATAAPFAQLQNMTNDVQILPGLNEIDSGIYAGQPIASLSGFLYELTPLLWSLLGLVLVPIPGSTEDPNGVVLSANFTGAMNTMYSAAMANPVVSDNGAITVVGFDNEADVAAWVGMNATNPDISFLLPQTIKTMFANDDGSPLLPNTGVIELEGNPTDGWRVLNWNGTPFPEDPTLFTKLIMDVRELITTPQTALWNVHEAFLSGDPTAVVNALATGLQSVAEVYLQFPVNVVTDIVGELSA